jgi:hypothetical protein
MYAFLFALLYTKDYLTLRDPIRKLYVFKFIKVSCGPSVYRSIFIQGTMVAWYKS